MNVSVEIPEYTGKSVLLVYEREPRVRVTETDGVVLLEANVDGLVTLARQLLTLAQDGMPDGNHMHHDTYPAGWLEPDGADLILERRDSFG